jgi:hypothetical protein
VDAVLGVDDAAIAVRAEVLKLPRAKADSRRRQALGLAPAGALSATPATVNYQLAAGARTP